MGTPKPYANAYYVIFKNTYRYEDENDNRFIAIDGYPDDPNAEGTVIATVVRTPHNDLAVVWHQNGYRAHQTVLDLIEDSKVLLTGGEYQPNNA